MSTNDIHVRKKNQISTLLTFNDINFIASEDEFHPLVKQLCIT